LGTLMDGSSMGAVIINAAVLLLGSLGRWRRIYRKIAT